MSLLAYLWQMPLSIGENNSANFFKDLLKKNVKSQENMNFWRQKTQGEFAPIHGFFPINFTRALKTD